MLDVIVKGLKVVVVSDCCGYLLTPSVTLAFPCNVLKSGTNLRNAINTSPATFGPVACPFWFLDLCSKSKSNDCIKEDTAVVVPFGFT